MDLGFGNSNQKVGTAATSLMLQTAKAQEKALEDEVAAYDALLENDDALELLRQKATGAIETRSNQQAAVEVSGTWRICRVGRE